MSQLIIDLDKCFECGHDNPINIEMHHVVPQSLNGTKTIPLCVKCHGLVHDRNFIKHTGKNVSRSSFWDRIANKNS